MDDPRWASDSEDPALLRQWLHVATKGLCNSASERISEEVTMHYDGAMEELLGHDCHWVIADEKAVKHLGDPKKANREYRKIYFTKEEERILSQYTKPWGKKPWVFTVLALITAASFLLAQITHYGYALTSLCAFCLIDYVCIPLIGRRDARSAMYYTVASLGVFYFVSFVFILGRPLLESLPTILAIFGGYTLVHYSTFKKIDTSSPTVPRPRVGHE
jgi:hypothetical protein